jgi:heme-degrading monooxygenase HmoA
VFGRLTRFTGFADESTVEQYVGLVRERVLPVVRSIPGFSGYLALTDGERGEVLVLTLWASEQELHESEEITVRGLRRALSRRHQRARRLERLSRLSAQDLERESQRAAPADERGELVPVDEVGEHVRDNAGQAEPPELLAAPGPHEPLLGAALVEVNVLDFSCIHGSKAVA